MLFLVNYSGNFVLFESDRLEPLEVILIVKQFLLVRMNRSYFHYVCNQLMTSII